MALVDVEYTEHDDKIVNKETYRIYRCGYRMGYMQGYEDAQHDINKKITHQSQVVCGDEVEFEFEGTIRSFFVTSIEDQWFTGVNSEGTIFSVDFLSRPVYLSGNHSKMVESCAKILEREAKSKETINGQN